MSTKYTPAPWAIGKQASLVVFANRVCIASCGGHQDNTRDCEELRAEQEANAQLIAAAPELLESLQWYVENDDVMLEMVGNEFYANGYYKAKAVIAKALGETNGN